MRLLDIFKMKNSVDSNETKSKVVENNVVNNINDNKKFEGKYSFLNNFKHLSVFTGLSDEEINSYSQEFFEKFKIDLPEDVKEFLKVTNGLFGAGGEYFLSKFNDEVKNINPKIMDIETFDIIRRNEYERMLGDIEEFIILGDDSLSYYVYDIKSKKYQDLSHGSLDVLNEYDEFAKMVEDVLTSNDAFLKGYSYEK